MTDVATLAALALIGAGVLWVIAAELINGDWI